MARVVESVVPAYGRQVFWEKVITKELMGAKRYMELSRLHGRNLPVPSIIINGQLIFETTPSLEELKAWLDRLVTESV